MTDNVQKEQNTDESIEERVVNKLKKVITIKRELSDKQKAHTEKLGKAKKGKKYVEQVEVQDVELPTEVKKPRAPRVKPIPEPTEEESSEPEVIVVKKKKKKQIIVEESESEEDEPVKKAKKKPVAKAKPKAKPVVKRKPVEKKQEPKEPEEPLSYFRKRLF